MGVPDLPADLLSFLRSGSDPTLDAGHYETVMQAKRERNWWKRVGICLAVGFVLYGAYCVYAMIDLFIHFGEDLD